MGTNPNRMCVLAALLALSLVATSVDAADKCQVGCRGSSSDLFKYSEGTSYQYQLDSHAEVTLSGADHQQTGIRIKATVLVTQLPECAQLVSLKGVQVSGPDHKKYTSGGDLDKPVRFLFHDGHVEDEICIVAGDSQNSLNIKRAVISMLQANIKGHNEIDVFGDCPTLFTMTKEGGETIIRKTRNLNHCSHRESFNQDFLATSFNMHSGIKASPFLHGDYVSTQRVKNGILQSTEVVEKYLYKPHSHGEHGARVTVTTKLTFTRQSKEAVPQKTSQPRSIIFENPHLVNTPSSNINNLVTSLKTALEASISPDGVKLGAARNFASLVNTMRVTPKEDILSVYGQVKAGAGFNNKEAAKQLYLEALSRAGTGDTIEVAIQLLKNKEVNEEQQKLLYLGLAFVRHASSASLGAAAQLLDMQHVPREAYLGVGTLAGKYCRDHNCNKDENLNKLTQKMITKLGSCQTHNREEENQIIAVLKGLGNFGHLSDSVLDKLVNCAKNKKIQPRIRVAALETFTADAGKPKIKKAALEIMANREEDSEIRIKAYLAAVSCPCGQTANKLKDMLASEPVNQVGSFITSHLRNIRASSSPDKDAAKQHLGMIRSWKKFPIDVRRFSFNSELSNAFDTLGMATQMESNVIYSQNSFLPRSVSLNLTSEIFGHRFNLADVELRQENLDRVAEKYFGPRGTVSMTSPENMIEKGKAELQHIMEKIKQRMEKTKRGRRDISRAELENFAKKVILATSPIDADLDLDLSIKLFGSELAFFTVNENMVKSSPDAVIDQIFDCIDNGIEKAKHFEYHVRPHAVFLDAEMVYPTAVGVPLKLGLVGSVAAQLKTSGSIDVRAFLRKEHNNKFDISFIPSANIEFVGTLSFDAHQVETGLQMSSSMHTATGTELAVEFFDDGRGVNVKVGLPVKEQDVFTFKHDLVFVTREFGHSEVETPLKFNDNRKQYHGCWDQFSTLSGLTFCGDIDIPMNVPGVDKEYHGAHFPLSGPAKMSFHIKRDDTKDYVFRAVVKDQDPHHKKIELSLDTPNSKVNRKVSLILEGMTQPDKMIKATFNSPFKNAAVEGRLIDNNKEHSVVVKLNDDANEYKVKFGVTVTGNEAKSRYTPLVEYTMPHQQGTKGGVQASTVVQGSIVIERGPDGRKYTFDNVRVTMPNHQHPFLVQGYAQRQAHIYSADLSVSQDQMKVGFKGKLNAADVKDVKFNAEVTNTINPNVNIHLDAEYKRSDDNWNYKMELVHGTDLNSKTNRLTYKSKSTYKYESPKSFDMSYSSHFKYPLIAIETELEGRTTPNSFKYDIEFAYDKFKAGSELDIEVNKKNKGDYSVEFEASGVDTKIRIEAKRDVIGEHKSKFHNALKLNDRVYSIDADVKHDLQHDDCDFTMDAVMKVHGKAEPIKLNIKTLMKPSHHEFVLILLDTAKKTPCVDVLYKTDRAGTSNGHLKMNMMEIMVIDGSLDIKNHKGNWYILFDMKKLNRKIKAETTFTILKPTIDIDFNLYTNFEKDNSKKINFMTKNKVDEHSIDSKTLLDVLSQQTIFNFNGRIDGKFFDGKLNGMFELTFPGGNYLTGKVNREAHLIQGTANGHGVLELEARENKNSKGRKFILDATIKDTNREMHKYDVKYIITLENLEGQQMITDFAMIHNHNNDKRHSILKYKLHGSMIKSPIEFNMNGDYTEHVGDFKVNGKYGSQTSMILDFKHDCGMATPNKHTYDIIFVMNIPHDHYKTIKYMSAGSIMRPKSNEEQLEIITSDSITINNDKSIKLDTAVRGNKDQGSGKVSVTMSDGQPITVSVNYKRQGDNTMSFSTDIAQVGEQGKEVKMSIAVTRPHPDQLTLRLNLLTPVETMRVIDLSINSKRTGQNFHTEVNLNANSKKYGLIGDVSISETSPSFDIQCTCPDGDKKRIAVKFNNLGDHRYTGEVILLNIKDFNFEGKGEATLESIDSFVIKMDVNSEKLNLKNVHVEIINSPAKGGKKIQFSAKSGATNLISGVTSYKTKEEGGKLIVEGSGTVKIKEESKSANFKFIKKTFNPEKDGMKGNEVTLNIGVGNINIVNEYHLSDKQFQVHCSYCAEKEQCAHVEISAKRNYKEDSLNQETQLSIDLRKFGFSHEFGMKSVYDRRQSDMEHVIDIFFHAKDKKSYQYKLYAHPKNAGITFTMPQRIVSMEAVMEVSPNQRKIEFTGYFDKKNHPEQKAVLSAYSQFVKTNDESSAEGQIKFSHPVLGKDLIIFGRTSTNVPKRTVNFNIDVDVFAKKNQKWSLVGKAVGYRSGDKYYEATANIDVTCEAHSIKYSYVEHLSVSVDKYSNSFKASFQDSKHKRDAEYRFEAGKNKFELYFKGPHALWVHILSQMNMQKDHQVIKTEYNLYGSRSVVTETEIKDASSFTHTIWRKDTPQNKIQTVGSFAFGKAGQIKSEIIKGGAKKELYHVNVKLDETHFLETDYNVNTENIQEVMQHVKNDAAESGKKRIEMLEQVKKDALEEVEHLRQILSSSLPDFTKLNDYYKTNLHAIREELISDETLKKMSEFINEVFGAIVRTVTDLMTKINHSIHKITRAVHEHWDKLINTITQEVIPQIREIATRFAQTIVGMFNKIVDVVFLYVSKMMEIVKVHQEDFKKLMGAIGDSTKDIVRSFVQSIAQIRTEVAKLISAIVEQVKSLPIVETIKERYSEFTGGMVVPEHLLEVSNEFMKTFTQMLPTPELQESVTKFYEYLVKKLKQEKIDDESALRSIYESFYRAIRSIFRMMEDQIEGNRPAPFFAPPAWSVEDASWWRIPRIGDVKVSSVDFLASDDFPTLSDMFKSHKLRLNPAKNIVPFDMHAMMVDGQHIFTYDERHITFPGNCDYVLTEDYLDGNFSLVANLKNGKIESITLMDDKDTITVKKGGMIKHNGASAEFPISAKHIAAWQEWHSINLHSDAGFRMICSKDLVVCGVQVSGYYHGRLRGLFGNGNNEHYDDFALPSGRVAKSEGEFGNAYKLRSSCPNVKTVDHTMHDEGHHHHSSEVCTKLFSSESGLRNCFSFIGVNNFRQACEHAVASGDKDIPCRLAHGYAYACVDANVLGIKMPDMCNECDQMEHKVAHHDVVSVKTPQSKADVVIVMDQYKYNEDVYKTLINPLVKQITSDYKSRGVNDVNIALIGFDDFPWPRLFTNGGKTQYKGQPINIKFTEHHGPHEFNTGLKKFDQLLYSVFAARDYLNIEFGRIGLSRAHRMALNYPWRPNAVKSLIGVYSRPCDESSNPLSVSMLRVALLLHKIHEIGATYNVITPLSETHINTKDQKVSKSFMGFSKDSVYLMGEKKAVNLRDQVEFKSDRCVEASTKSDGAVFSSSVFKSAKDNQKKQYVSTVSRVIVEQSLATEIHSECTCEAKWNIFPYMHCRTTSRKSERTKSGTKG